MKVILLQDVAKIGRRFEVVEVPDGYAFNKLIPQKQAEAATPANLKRVEAQARKLAEFAADESEQFSTSVASLKDKTVTMTVPGNDDGKLFEALKPAAVIEAVSNETGVKLNEQWVQIVNPIKTTGEHIVLLSLGEDQGEFTVNVVSQK